MVTKKQPRKRTARKPPSPAAAATVPTGKTDTAGENGAECNAEIAGQFYCNRKRGHKGKHSTPVPDDGVTIYWDESAQGFSSKED